MARVSGRLAFPDHAEQEHCLPDRGILRDGSSACAEHIRAAVESHASKAGWNELAVQSQLSGQRDRSLVDGPRAESCDLCSRQLHRRTVRTPRCRALLVAGKYASAAVAHAIESCTGAVLRPAGI